MKTSDKVLRYLLNNGQSSIATMAEKFKISRQYLHRVLNELEAQDLVKKDGTPPKVIYDVVRIKNANSINSINFASEKFLADHFIAIDALGQLLEGHTAMQYWCSKQNLPFEKTVEEYIATRTKYLNFYNVEHLIDGLDKLTTTKGIDTIGVDALYYLDFYAIERFDKTRLGTLMHYAKQGQNKMLMKRIIIETKQSILRMIQQQNITAIVYVPPTIKRQIQIMDFLKKNLQLDLPIVQVDKLKGQIVVPQKALSKIFERIENAKNTFYVPPQKKHSHILILDDAIGSGATINEIAIKLKERKVTTKITGLAITGSYKGFEVISEL